jgi:large subunit ribosomal protein L15
LIGSGQEVVVAQALYAIVGAIALERGGEVANRIARERVLKPLGVTFPTVV